MFADPDKRFECPTESLINRSCGHYALLLPADERAALFIRGKRRQKIGFTAGHG